jgi:DNA-binding Xre family transcriptional regulator
MHTYWKNFAVDFIIGMAHHSTLKSRMLKYSADSYSDEFKDFIQSPDYKEDQIKTMVKAIEVTNEIYDALFITVDNNLVRFVREINTSSENIEDFNTDKTQTIELICTELDLNTNDIIIKKQAEDFLLAVSDFLIELEERSK